MIMASPRTREQGVCGRRTCLPLRSHARNVSYASVGARRALNFGFIDNGERRWRSDYRTRGRLGASLATEAVQALHDQGFAGAQVVQHGALLRAVVVGAGGDVGEDPLAAGGLQGLTLQGAVMLASGNPRVPEGWLTGMDRRETVGRPSCATSVSDMSSGRHHRGVSRSR